jgi:tryptophan 2,3-dioxygenase
MSPEPKPLSYSDYLKVGELLRLQVPLASPPVHDELFFIVIHQAYELWFKQILHDADGAVAAMDADDPRTALHLVRRCGLIQKHLVSQIHLLEAMTPMDFLRFREKLKPASGFQSVQFREVEFALGLRNVEILKAFEGDAEATRRLTLRLSRPSLRDAFLALLRRHGFRLPDGDAAKAERVQSLLRLYLEPQRYWDFYQLAEALLELDEQLSLWRLHHINMVERQIGAKPGTGGSEGIGYLRRTLDARGFPELWELRSQLEIPY